jgi:hypothetical protein
MTQVRRWTANLFLRIEVCVHHKVNGANSKVRAQSRQRYVTAVLDSDEINVTTRIEFTQINCVSLTGAQCFRPLFRPYIVPT